MINLEVVGKVKRSFKFEKDGKPPVWFVDLDVDDDDGVVTTLKCVATKALQEGVEGPFRVGIDHVSFAKGFSRKDGSIGAAMDVQNRFHILN